MASAAFVAINPFLRPKSREPLRVQMPEWKRLIAVCDERIRHYIHTPSERNRLRLEDHLMVMACSNSKKVKARRKKALAMYKELTHGH